MIYYIMFLFYDLSSCVFIGEPIKMYFGNAFVCNAYLKFIFSVIDSFNMKCIKLNTRFQENCINLQNHLKFTMECTSQRELEPNKQIHFPFCSDCWNIHFDTNSV